MSLSPLLAFLPLDAIVTHAEALLQSHSQAETVDLLGDLIDDLVDWDEILSGPLGELIEEHDDEIGRALAQMLIEQIGAQGERADRMLARAARLDLRAAKHPERAARLQRRASRLVARAAELRS